MMRLFMMATLMFASAFAQDMGGVSTRLNRIDLVRPDAPELAAHGAFDIGVQTLELVNPAQLDIVNAVEGEETPLYNRELTLEIWYPAQLDGATPFGEYTVITTDGETEATLFGQAVRDAQPLTDTAPYPLVIFSHGYPGNRFLLSHLAENLATKGYVVASIDHTDSTYSDQGVFGSTLLNRPLDQLFVLDELERLSSESGQFLDGLVDTDNTGIVGYSMGGYGVVNLLGGGFSESILDFPASPPNGVLAQRVAGSEAYTGGSDERIKAAIAVAPWGMNYALWDAEGLAGIETPMMFVAGSKDDIAGYEDGVRAIYEGAVNSERYLLTFMNANHNAAAPIPAPAEVWDNGTYDHYSDPVWDTLRMNNIFQHFATAYLDLYLKGDTAIAAYLDLVPAAEDGVWSLDDDGEPTDEHTYWQGFPERTALGLMLENETP